MATARDLMTPGTDCIGENETLNEAARKLRDLELGSLPICGVDGQLLGMLSDRDIMVKCLAEGGDPASVTAGSLAEGKPVTIDADDGIEDAIETMMVHDLRRLPVIDADQHLVGMLGQDDLASALPPEMIADLLDELSD